MLPLRRDLVRVAVIGPNANSVRNLFGGYSAPQQIEMFTSGDMGLPAPVQGGEVNDDVMAAVIPAGPDEARDTGQDFGYVRRIATRPSEAALAAIDAAYGHVPTVLSAICGDRGRPNRSRLCPRVPRERTRRWTAYPRP